MEGTENSAVLRITNNYYSLLSIHIFSSIVSCRPTLTTRIYTYESALGPTIIYIYISRLFQGWLYLVGEGAAG